MRRFPMFAFLLALVGVPAYVAAHTAEEEDAERQRNWTVDDGTTIEIALGATQLFAPDSLGSDVVNVVPTQTTMLMVEWYMHYRWHLALWFNLPTAPSLTFENGELVQGYVPPALALGVIWVPLTVPFSQKRHRIELHGGIFAGATLSLTGNFFAIGALRLYVLHESGFGVYAGVAAAPRLDTAAMVYGIGYRF